MSLRRSIARTARHHRDLDRRSRSQHSPPVTWAIKTSGSWDARGYHNCRCSACNRFRGFKARQSVKFICAQLAGDSWHP